MMLTRIQWASAFVKRGSRYSVPCGAGFGARLVAVVPFGLAGFRFPFGAFAPALRAITDLPFTQSLV